MKILISSILFFILGLGVSQFPDLFMLYNDHVMYTYRDKTCDSKKDPESCDFFKWYDSYVNENPTIEKIDSYFIMGEGHLYMALSGKCSNHIFHNKNASKDSGKITNRQYFFIKCSKFSIYLSDLIYRDSDKETYFDSNRDHL